MRESVKEKQNNSIQSCCYNCLNLPPKGSNTIRLYCISDTHERHTVFKDISEALDCDILVHAGDILMTNRFMTDAGSIQKLHSFNNWLDKQKVKHRILIPGNHDRIIEEIDRQTINQIFTNTKILINETIELEGLRIFASPISYGASKNKAFQSKEFTKQCINKSKEVISEQSIDILITHGSCEDIADIINPTQLHIYGHYHADHGARWNNNNNNCFTVCVCAMDASYNPHHFPFIIDIPRLES